MDKRTFQVASLLFVSGLCALIYQVAWFREFHLVFGASHPATAAVLAVFMGGLGLGNYLLGHRADRHENPLLLYARLELFISLLCAVSPWLIDLARAGYVALGGQMNLGATGATLTRLLLGLLVLGLPTVLMGGTLPAAARAVTTAHDANRRGIGWLYGFNTLGAVAGAGLSTFLLLEWLGTRTTLWVACAINLATSFAARALSRRMTAGENTPQDTIAPTSLKSESDRPATSATLIYAGAGLVGFAFFLMEMVWYRMLAPLLGGTTYTFGLILAVALTGIGLGAALFPFLFAGRRPTLGDFALTCALEALALAIPFALGDRLAVLALLLRDLSVFGFTGSTIGWIVVASLVVLPAAIMSGLQFPLLTALVGQSESHIGAQVGQTFLWNTVGCILGSLAGGFGLLPWLGAVGVWKAVVLLLAGLGGIAFLKWFAHTSQDNEAAGPPSPPRRRVGAGLSGLAMAACVAGAIACLRTDGPTAAWRHSAIGAGRTQLVDRTRNGVRDWIHRHRRVTVWEADGLEASVALNAEHTLAFFVNGKSDGASIYDAPTQVMSGLLGALLHGAPKSALVVGLGTGETAGWLAEVPSMEQVECVELERALDEMARRCAAVNHNVLVHPKVHRIYTDAREVLLTAPRSFDLIVSEPSNPYRAGVANLYTQEYYRAALARLNAGGLFCQFLQGYEVDVETFRTVLLTLRSVFNHVEVWETKPHDLLLVCSDRPLRHSADELRKRIAQEPYRSALRLTWRAGDLEGVLARFVVAAGFVEQIQKVNPPLLNSDDKNRIEYGFARSVGQQTGFSIPQMRDQARRTAAHRPALDGTVDWARVEEQRTAVYALWAGLVILPANATEGQKARGLAWGAYISGQMSEVLRHWAAQDREPADSMELLMLASAAAEMADERAEKWIEQLRAVRPLEAEGLTAIYRFRNNEAEQAVAALESFCQGMRNDPWTDAHVLDFVLNRSPQIAGAHPTMARRIWDALKEPFALLAAEELRRYMTFALSASLSPAEVAASLEPYEPHVIWNQDFLQRRYQAYDKLSHPRFLQAVSDLQEGFRVFSTEPQ